MFGIIVTRVSSHHPGPVVVGLKQLDEGQDCFLITDRSGVLAFHALTHLSFFMCSILFSCIITLYNVFSFLCIYGLLGLLPTSGENFKSTATLEIYLLGKIVTCSILISPAVLPQLTENSQKSV